MVKKVFFKTFGCRTNIYDTQIMIENLKDFEVVNSEEKADIVVVNSCTVTNGADSGVRSYINSANKHGKRVVIAGCGALSKGEELFANEKVFGVMGHSEKEKINTLLKSDEKFFKLGDLETLDKTIVQDYAGKTKAFIKIQEGCDFRCSYCIIPYVRGDARSQDEKLIVEQIEKLARNGYGEFVLTGTNIGSYGKDTHSSLGALLHKIGKIQGVRRVRLGSIEPVQIDERFYEVLDEPWLERHLHVALQHTSQEMLKIMRRRNHVAKDLMLFEFLADKGYALGTDFIVGHPGESEVLWQEAYSMLERFPLTHIHTFIYSKRDGTPSAKMKETLKGDVAKARLKQVEDLVEKKNYNFRKALKSSLDVLVEDKKGDTYSGFDQYYNKVIINSKQDISKEWLHVEFFEAKKDANYANFKI
ncbi:MAG: tRNA (N(6)-L-threonylcarbamoyladenosine(37)-C(2))-methylthiotransferase MtaB [Sulfurospirillaceae bacterium]|nr:tRNA (N(6)-L-threonylcarbamoyladenosine(37)-C(2))-methylthiotransferase MtaB [Sulfurospirillaceae bacterium]